MKPHRRLCILRNQENKSVSPPPVLYTKATIYTDHLHLLISWHPNLLKLCLSIYGSFMLKIDENVRKHPYYISTNNVAVMRQFSKRTVLGGGR